MAIKSVLRLQSVWPHPSLWTWITSINSNCLTGARNTLYKYYIVFLNVTLKFRNASLSQFSSKLTQIKNKQVPTDFQRLWVTLSSISCNGSYTGTDQSWRHVGRPSFLSYRSRNEFSCGWSEKLVAVFHSSVRLFHRQSNEVIFVGLIT